MNTLQIFSTAARRLATTVLSGLALSSQLLALVPDAPDYPAFGGSMDQVMRFYVSLLDRQQVRDAPDRCVASVGFLDEVGKPIGPSRLVNLTTPGQATFIEFAYGSFLGRRGERREIKPVLEYLEGSGECATAVEIYDQYFNRDQLHRSPRPASLRLIPEFAMVGAAWGQTVRLSLAVVDPNMLTGVDADEKVTLAFFDNGGKQVGPAKTFNPGKAMEFLDLNVSGLAPFGQRIGIRPVITIEFSTRTTPIPFDDWARAAVQVFDTATGFTQILDEPLW